MKTLYTFSFILLFSLPTWLNGQDGARVLTLEDIYKNNTYATRYYRSVRWLEDSESYTTLENNPTLRCSEVILYHAKSGDREVLVGPVSLYPKENCIHSGSGIIHGRPTIASSCYLLTPNEYGDTILVEITGYSILKQAAWSEWVAHFQSPP